MASKYSETLKYGNAIFSSPILYLPRFFFSLFSLVTVAFIKQELREENMRLQQNINSEKLQLLFGTIGAINSSLHRNVKQELENINSKYSDILASVKNVTMMNEISEKLLHDLNDNLNNDSETKTSQLNDIFKKLTRSSVEVVDLQQNTEKLFHDLMTHFRSDVYDKIENLISVFGMDSENKTIQIKSLLYQINRTSDDLLNLHLKIGNITTGLNRLDDIRQHLLEESEKRNVSEIYFSKFYDQSKAENKEIINSVEMLLERIDLIDNYLGGSFRNIF